MKRLLLALSLAVIAAGAQAQTVDDRFATPGRKTTAHAAPQGSNPSPVSALVKWLKSKTATTAAAQKPASHTTHRALVVETPVATPQEPTPPPRVVATRSEEAHIFEEPRQRHSIGHGRGYHSCVEGERVISAFYWEGSHTASGARFNPDGMTAAHRTLPFGTRLMVINPRNGRSVTVTVNDRGPFVKGVTLDLARGAAQAIGLRGTGAVCMAKA